MIDKRLIGINCNVAVLSSAGLLLLRLALSTDHILVVFTIVINIIYALAER